SVKDSSLSRSVKVTSLPLADYFQLAAARVRAKLEVGQQFLGNRERNRPNRGEPIQRTYAPWNTRIVQKFWPARTDCMLSALLHFLFFWHFSGFLTSRVSFEAWHRDASAVLVCPHGGLLRPRSQCDSGRDRTSHVWRNPQVAADKAVYSTLMPLALII